MTTSTARPGVRVGIQLQVPAWLRGVWRELAGAVVAGALLVLISPFAAAVAALVAASVGIGLSEARREGAARAVLFASLGLMAPALADLVVQLARLL